MCHIIVLAFIRITLLRVKQCLAVMCLDTRLCFYQTRLAWSVDQGSNKNHSPAYNFVPTVTKFCVMWEGLSLPHDTKFGNCRCKTVDSRAFPSWSLIHGLRWSGLIKAKPVRQTRSMDYTNNSIVNPVSDNKDFLTWLLIGWRFAASQSETMFENTNVDFNIEISE